jgi:CBS domain-containing protein/gamma-glutamylcysteine synthetase
MGELNVRNIEKGSDTSRYTKRLLNDITAIEQMLANGMFEKETVRIGAEQEFCLVNGEWEPTNKSMEVLEDLQDDHFTTELALYNLEANLDPLVFTGNCFSQMHKQLDSLLSKAQAAAQKHQLKIILAGILPTISTKHLQMSYMTPLERYKVLDEAIKRIRKDDIELHIKGADELNLHHDSILYESCNTSFQAHLQIDPDDFVNTYNWAQAIAGPVLSICANSPLVMGRELWEETRIALFSQSVDTRASSNLLSERESRVGFGSDWAKGTIVDHYKESIVRFRSLLTTDIELDSLSELENGKIPKLRALNLHNGTVYKWNRLCYGVTEGNPHVRLECRYIPCGPSTTDEIANMMFWTGVMRGRPKEFDEIHSKMDFKDAKSNFFNGARYGMAAQFYWDGKLISSRDMILEHLLPMASRGLHSMKVAPKDVNYYLTIIENRAKSMNGARWSVLAYRKLKKTHKTPDALKILVAAMYEKQQKRYTVDVWQLPRGNEFKRAKEDKKVGDYMNTKTITAHENDSALLVLKMMQWKNIHHLPILDDNRGLSGLLTWTDVNERLKNTETLDKCVNKIMRKKLITANDEMPVMEAKALMEANDINCLPVVKDQKLLGIISSKDLPN